MSPYLVIFLILLTPIFLLIFGVMRSTMRDLVINEGHAQASTAGVAASSALQASLIAGVLTGVGALVSFVSPW